MGTADLTWRSDWSVNVCISISCVWPGSINAFTHCCVLLYLFTNNRHLCQTALCQLISRAVEVQNALAHFTTVRVSNVRLNEGTGRPAIFHQTDVCLLTYASRIQQLVLILGLASGRSPSVSQTVIRRTEKDSLRCNLWCPMTAYCFYLNTIFCYQKLWRPINSATLLVSSNHTRFPATTRPQTYLLFLQ